MGSNLVQSWNWKDYYSSLQIAGQKVLTIIHTVRLHMRACCSQSEFRIRESIACTLFLYNCTPNNLCERSVECIYWPVGLIHLLFGNFILLAIFKSFFKLSKMSYHIQKTKKLFYSCMNQIDNCVFTLYSRIQTTYCACASILMLAHPSGSST